MDQTILGIDCGANGALGLLSYPYGRVLSVHDMPTVEIKIGKTKRKRTAPALLVDLIKQLAPTSAAIEKIHGMPQMAGTAMFSLGYSAGLVEGVLASLGVPIIFVSPQSWKRGMQVGKDKGICRQRAMALWPEQATLFARVKDDSRAEACLIAKYGIIANYGMVFPQ